MHEDAIIDRMAIAIAYGTQSGALIDALNAAQIPVTLIDARGGFLEEAMVTLVAGMPRQQLPQFFALVRQHCAVRTRLMPIGVDLPGYAEGQIIEVRVGGATVFVVPVDEFLQL
ncbi:MAG: cyclic-di-AMP receptor [Anaerolineae bacterium]